MKHFLAIIILSFFFLYSSFGQSKPIDSIVSALQKDQLLFEKVFIHTNKTNYDNEDVIWFKVYVANQDNKPSLKTARVYVSLFSEYGKLINTKTVYIKNGVGTNQLNISQDLVAGKYFIQAYTNNMLNFGDHNKFVSAIVVGEKRIEKTVSGAKYDIQFFPEGGHFLEGVKNVVSIKALINGRACNYKGKIVNSKNKEVAMFSSLHLGMSKSQFEYRKGEKYKAIIEVNDTIIKTEMPKALEVGVSISKISDNKDVVKFELVANKGASLDDYILLFHQKNTIIDYVNVDFNNLKKRTFVFNKKDFLKGVNSLIVLKNNKPILERKFFVAGIIKNEFSIEKLNRLEDSIVYKFKVKDVKSKSNISLSVLTLSSNYTSTTDIASAMYLTPYVKGYVENPSFYFNEENINREAYLDLLLLTQGWIQYDCEDFIKEINPELKHNFEKGFALKGKLNPVFNNNLGMFTMDNQMITKQFLNNQTLFSFKNLVAFKGDSIKLAFIDREVLRIKPKRIQFDSIETNQDSFVFNFEKEYLKSAKNDTTKQLEINKTRYLSNKKDVLSLETVNLKTKKKSKAFLDRKAFDEKHRKEVFHIGAYYELGVLEDYVIEDSSLREYLENRLFKIKRSSMGDLFLLKVDRVVLVTIDGKPVFPKRGGIPLEVVLGMGMASVDNILFQPKVTPGTDALAIFTTDDYKNGTTNNFTTYVFKKGYSRSKKYYKPLFLESNDVVGQEIDWKPSLVSNVKGEVVFKLKEDLNNKNLLFSIQGFSDNGELISGFYKLDNTKIK
ncbi:hypothetical protein [Lacinutrix algicola]|uniref:hypothetical protein n=1 Tax=Lacinutrix algicola TaxID=342954 RepID=UPI000AB7116C|nr:hypothetical protein [Lacinutrix algicola]